jgi:hypothetical protein
MHSVWPALALHRIANAAQLRLDTLWGEVQILLVAGGFALRLTLLIQAYFRLLTWYSLSQFGNSLSRFGNSFVTELARELGFLYALERLARTGLLRPGEVRIGLSRLARLRADPRASAPGAQITREHPLERELFASGQLPVEVSTLIPCTLQNAALWIRHVAAAGLDLRTREVTEAVSHDFLDEPVASIRAELPPGLRAPRPG